MLRLSRPTTGLLTAAAFLSALCTWDRCAGPRDESPLDRVGALLAVRPPRNAAEDAAYEADVMGRSRRLQEVSDEVRAGRLGLLDAAARVRDVQVASPYFRWDLFRSVQPGATDDERFCRMVIEVASRPADSGGAPDAVAARLRAELQERLKQGPIRLP